MRYGTKQQTARLWQNNTAKMPKNTKNGNRGVRVRPASGSKPAPQRKKGSKPKKAVVNSGLDAHGTAWRKLLADPCNAPMVAPCYAGTGSGYYARIRQIIDIPATAKDYVLEFSPGFGGSRLFRYTWSDTVFGSLGNASAIPAGGFLGSAVVGRARCIAGCAQVLYTGTVLERKGTVAVSNDQAITLIDGEAVAGTAGSWMAGMPHYEPVSDHMREFKWLPGPGDERFRNTNETTEELGSTEGSGASMQLVLNNIHPGSIRLSFVTVWEWQPEQELYTGMVVTNTTPPSRNTLNDVLRSIGHAANFVSGAYDQYRHLKNTIGPALSMLAL